MGLPGHPYVVLDMNHCRRHETVAELIREYDRSGQLIVLPRIWGYEATKSEDAAFSTFEASTRHFLHRPDAFAVAEVPYLLRLQEKRVQRPARLSEIVNAEHTEDFRLILRRLNAGGSDVVRVLERYLADTARYWKRIMTKRGGVLVVRRLVGLFDNVYKDRKVEDPSIPSADALRPLIKAARKALPRGDRGPLRELIFATASHRPIEKFLGSMGYSPGSARGVAVAPSFSFTEYFVFLSIAFRWQLLRGIDTYTDDEIESDLCDTEYAQSALFGRGIVSDDGWVRDVYEDMSVLSPRFWP